MSYYTSAWTKYLIKEMRNGNWEKRIQDRKLLVISDLIISFKNESLNKRIQYCRRITWNAQKKSF